MSAVQTGSPTAIETMLRKHAVELLQSETVSVVIGYAAGSTPFKTTPVFVRTPEEAEQLVWNPACVNNLAVYLPRVRKAGRVGIVLKPCDIPSFQELMREHQMEREQVVVIGVACGGVADTVTLASAADSMAIEALLWSDAGVAAQRSDGVRPVDPAVKCRGCTLDQQAGADVFFGEPPAARPGEAVDELAEQYAQMGPAQRRQFWADAFGRCIRCYACRSVCPACYCTECFVDKHGQYWAAKATTAEANWFFHVTRMMHLAGRCVGCNECDRACPVDIPLRLLTQGVNRQVEALFGDAPHDANTAPVMGSYRDHDPDPCPE